MQRLFTITPSNFRNDPSGHFWNQLTHGLIGAGLMGVLPVFWPWVAAISLAYLIIIEWPQVQANNVRWVRIDSIEDTLHFTMGALIVFTGAKWALVAWLFTLGVGAWNRR